MSGGEKRKKTFIVIGRLTTPSAKIFKKEKEKKKSLPHHECRDETSLSSTYVVATSTE